MCGKYAYLFALLVDRGLGPRQFDYQFRTEEADFQVEIGFLQEFDVRRQLRIFAATKRAVLHYRQGNILWIGGEITPEQ